MILKRRGFSLAELLLAVGIIGIITAMGMAITKHTADKAYNGYWFTGYSTLTNMIAEFEKDNLFDEVPPPASGKQQIVSANIFAHELGRLLGTTSENNIVRAKNAISYSITGLPDINKKSDVNYMIDMTVPQAKSRKNPDGTGITRLVYIREKIDGQEEYQLIPVPHEGYTNLGQRRDLLPFYLDDGTPKRIPRPLSFEQAYCSCHAAGPKIADSAFSLIKAMLPEDLFNRFEIKRILAFGPAYAECVRYDTEGRCLQRPAGDPVEKDVDDPIFPPIQPPPENDDLEPAEPAEPTGPADPAIPNRYTEIFGCPAGSGGSTGIIRLINPAKVK